MLSYPVMNKLCLVFNCHGFAEFRSFSHLDQTRADQSWENFDFFFVGFERNVCVTGNFNAIYYGPTERQSKSVPLIVWPHGGPHSMFFECFSPFNQFFISAGMKIYLYCEGYGNGEFSPKIK